MSNALKGLLFSALIFPGAGQIILTRYRRGALFFGLAFISGLLCITGIVRQAVLVLQDLVARGEVITTPRVMGIVADISTYASSFLLKIVLLVFFCCWLSSAFDAWRIGRKMDGEQPPEIPEKEPTKQ
ncbi:MAG: hypothetical protein ABFR63_09585 [Thermodesulfobacteriota bacterium]